MSYVRIFTVLILATVSGSALAEDLMQVYQQAVTQDTQLRIANARYQSVLQETPLATSRFMPNLSAQAAYNHYHTDTYTKISESGESYETTSYGVTLSQPLIHIDAFSQSSQAKKVVMKGEVDLQTARQELIVRVAEQYFEVLAAKDNLRFARSEKSAIEKQLEQTKQRFNVGLIAITDVHESQARFDLAVAREIDAENRVANAHEALREVTGQYYKDLAGLAVDTPLLPPQPAAIDSWVDSAMKQNLNLLSKQWDVDIAQDGIGLQRAVRYPGMDLVGRYSVVDESQRVNGVEVDNASFSVQVNWQIYQGGAVGARVERARQETVLAQESLEAARRAVLRNTRDAYLGVLAGISRVKAFNQAVVSNKSALEATEAGYDVGTRTTVDVLDARTALFLAQSNYSQSRYDYIRATIRLKQAVGTLSETDIAQINTWLGPDAR